MASVTAAVVGVVVAVVSVFVILLERLQLLFVT
jgi:hypothetical protein